MRLSSYLPVAFAMSMAGAMGLDGMPFAITVMVGASCSFISPMGYQTNLMVFGPGRYRFLDIPRYGFPLTMAMSLTVPFLICRWFGL